MSQVENPPLRKIKERNHLFPGFVGVVLFFLNFKKKNHFFYRSLSERSRKVLERLLVECHRLVNEFIFFISSKFRKRLDLVS
jgi:hypothetical protein